MRRFGRREVGEEEQISRLLIELGFIPLSTCSEISESWRNQNQKVGLGWLWDSWVWLRRILAPIQAPLAQPNLHEGEDAVAVSWIPQCPVPPPTSPPLLGPSGEKHKRSCELPCRPPDHQLTSPS